MFSIFEGEKRLEDIKEFSQEQEAMCNCWAIPVQQPEHDSVLTNAQVTAITPKGQNLLSYLGFYCSVWKPRVSHRLAVLCNADKH